ncbi:MAG: CotH kinase family protein [Silvanigrellales bacterium]|nr:CotH kinase family protein [Silvanigrellales bacterium]
MNSRSKGGFSAILCFSLCFFVLACTTRRFNTSQLKSGASGPSGEEGRVSREEFFRSDKIWSVNVYGWDADKMQPWKIGTNSSTYGSTTEVVRIDKDAQPSCPTQAVKSADRVFKTQKFTLSIRGNKSRGTPKSSYLFKFTDSNEAFLGQKMFHMLGTWNDMSGMREAVTGSLHRFMGVPAPRHTFARMCVNGKYFGLYSIVEHVDDGFFKGVMGLDAAGNMYEGAVVDNVGTGDLQKRPGDPFTAYGNKGYTLMRNATGGDFSDLGKFIDAIHGAGAKSGPGSADWKRNLESVFDVKTFLRWMAVNNLVGGWDNYYWNPNNYFLVNAKGKGTDGQTQPAFRWIAVDLDNSFGLQFNDVDYRNASIVDWESVRDGVKLPLVTHVLKDKDYKTYYLDAIEYLLETKFNEDAIFSMQKDLFDGLLKTSVYMESDSSKCDGSKPEPYNCAHTGRQFENEGIYQNIMGRKSFKGWGSMRVASMANFARDRHASAKAQIAKLRSDFPRTTLNFSSETRLGGKNSGVGESASSGLETAAPTGDDISIPAGSSDKSRFTEPSVVE